MHKNTTLVSAQIRLFLLLTMAFGLAGCERQPIQSDPSPTETPVEVAKPMAWDGINTIRSMGRLVTEDSVTFSFKSPGVIEQVYVDIGDQVSEGQLLAQLQRTELQSLARRASESLAKANRDLERMEQLFERGVIPQQTVDDARTAREIAQAETESAAFNLALTEIHATQDGQVLQRLAEPSEIVQPGQAIIKVSGNASGWLLQLNLSDREIVELTHLNSIDVYFDALPGTAFAADISRIAGEANPATAMFAVELRLIDPDPRLRTGMLGTAFLTVVSPQRGLLIPVSALIAADREQGTLFVVENDTALKRQVTLGELRSTGVIVTAGLSNNDIVITGGAGYVDDGAKIRVLED